MDLLVLLIFSLIYVTIQNRRFTKQINAERIRADKAESDLAKHKSDKKSSEVRLGMISEKLAPFLKNFPCNPDDAHFLGQPIDYVVFDEDGVHFIEVKSGGAELSNKQRRIRNQIQDKKVFWHIMRVK